MTAWVPMCCCYLQGIVSVQGALGLGSPAFWRFALGGVAKWVWFSRPYQVWLARGSPNVAQTLPE